MRRMILPIMKSGKLQIITKKTILEYSEVLSPEDCIQHKNGIWVVYLKPEFPFQIM